MMSNGKYKMVEDPRARPKSGLTLLFEAYMMMLVESEHARGGGIEDGERNSSEYLAHLFPATLSISVMPVWC